jgi:hypothetical protein
MRKFFFLCAATALAVTQARAGDPPQTGTLISENSVSCGSKNHGKKKSEELLCQEYVIRAATTDYHVRQPKPSDKALIPVNTPIEFVLSKDKMKFKADGKSYEYLVVSEAAAGATPPPRQQ